MTAAAPWTAELETLLEQLIEGEFDAAARERLNALLAAGAEHRRYYRGYMKLHYGLEWRIGKANDSGRRVESGEWRVKSEEAEVESRESRVESESISGQWSVASGRKVESRESRVESESISGQWSVASGQELENQKSEIRNHKYPTPHAPRPSPLAAWAFSYAVATLLLSIALLAAWFSTITHYDADSLLVDANSRRVTPSVGTANEHPQFTFVGKVSGMVDCQFAESSTSTVAGAAVSLNRRYALKSGLLEISYDSGAKVILQGPCDYTVESRSSGFLGLGKLVARVGAGGVGRGTGEQKEERGERREESAKNQKLEIINHKSSALTLALSQRERGPDLNPTPHAPRPTPLFSVRTPTALVEDLGTEFGVEVSDSGETASHVFEGRVVMRAEGAGDGKVESGEWRVESKKQRPKTQDPRPKTEILLSAGQSARVERDDKSGELQLHSGKKADLSAPPKFVRRLREPPKFLDLLDIVAGGNGLGKRRESGIDPITGEQMTAADNVRRVGRGYYAPVGWNRFIDGVFVPDGWAGPIAVDSSGRLFGEFPTTVGRSWGPLWARAAECKPQTGDAAKAWIYKISGGERFMPDGRGLLCLHPNVGVTFNLGAIRAAYRGSRPTKFRTLAGLAEAAGTELNANSEAELWVIVNGQMKFRRGKITRRDGAIAVDVELGPQDRFLTLAVTEGSDGITSDWFVLGDPVLSMTSNGKENAEK